MANPEELKIPLIGNFSKLLKLMNVFHGESDRIEEIERELGEFVLKANQLKWILDFFFPVALDEIFKKRKWNSALFTFPLHLRDHHDDPSIRGIPHLSAWSNLMYDLGEFNIADRCSRNLIEAVMPHIYQKGKDWYAWRAAFKSPSGAKKVPDVENSADVIRKIWSRLIENDVQFVFIDDDKNFRNYFLGTESDETISYLNLATSTNCYDSLTKPLIVLNPGVPFEDNKLINTIEQLVNINEKKKKRLLIFVVDLMFKVNPNRDADPGSETVNSIKGHSLIRHIRSQKKESLIIGFTGGTSPFIINSAEKAGADIVVFKKRGERTGDAYGHTSEGNYTGLFDLLWAISWNVSVWRLLHIYKKYIIESNGRFENISLEFFPEPENISSFWKVFLKKWETEIYNAKLKGFFQARS